MDTGTHFKIKRMSPQFVVAHIDRSIEFYVKKLNFDIDFHYEDFYSGIVKDGYSIHFKSGKPLIQERKSRKNNEEPDIIFSVDRIEDLYEEISRKSAEIVQPLRVMPYGKEFYIADRDGYIIAFLEEA